jgi:uncharacterized protein
MFEQPLIEPVKFARDEASVGETLVPSQLKRLCDQLYDSEGTVAYRVSGFVTPKGEAALRLRVQGEVGLRCQRCLERLPFALDIYREIVLTQGLDEFEQPQDEDDAVDTIPLASPLDLRELVEEEVLLSMPMAPRHRQGACKADAPEQDDQGSESPFAALAKLKQ